MMRARVTRQRGVAVVTALLLTTLAVTIVTSLFWQQQVQIRSMENQRLQLQTKWALRAALDWSRQVLRDDAMTSSADHLGEPWAVPMSKVELDEYVENGREGGESSSAMLSGSIVDAQSRFNLSNLAQAGRIDRSEVAVYRNLLSILQLNASLAQATAERIAQTQMPAGGPGSGDQGHEMAALSHTIDLLTISGYTPAAVERLRQFVVLLPTSTVKSAVNVNTAPPEVLAAVLGKSPMEMTSLIHTRTQAYFTDPSNFQSRAGALLAMPDINMQNLSTRTDHFFVYGTVHMDRASVDMEALIYRKTNGNTTIRWVRSY
jgi:general secretion pathway protein K